MMNEFAAMIAAWIAVLYFGRMKNLNFFEHELSFVAQNIVSGGACVYSAYHLAQYGLDVGSLFTTLMGALYLLRSRDTYVEAITKPADLDGHDLTNAVWWRK